MFFNDVTIGRPPVVNFPMYPPVETAPAETSAPVYFEPLPDIAAKAAQLRQQQQQQANAAANAARLRPKISVVSRDRTDSDSDAVDTEVSQWCDAAYEQAKLERLLSQFPPLSVTVCMFAKLFVSVEACVSNTTLLTVVCLQFICA